MNLKLFKSFSSEFLFNSISLENYVLDPVNFYLYLNRLEKRESDLKPERLIELNVLSGLKTKTINEREKSRRVLDDEIRNYIVSDREENTKL